MDGNIPSQACGMYSVSAPSILPACAVKAGAIRHSRRYQRTVYFTMIKDVLHIMFTLVRKRKDSSF